MSGSNGRARSSPRKKKNTALPPIPFPYRGQMLDASEDERWENSDHYPRITSPFSQLPRQTKVYPRLHTLAQLVEKHVESLHTSEFVARSEQRWQRFASRNRELSRTDAITSDKNEAYKIVHNSAALVIQCYWRRYAAVLVLRRQLRELWRRQEAAAAWATSRAVLLTQVEKCLLQISENKYSSQFQLSTALPMLSCVFGQGIYYTLAAAMITWWLRFRCACTSTAFLRRPPVILQTIDIPVTRTLRLAGRLRRHITARAVTVLQNAFRSYFARQLTTKLRLEHRKTMASIRLQCFFRMHIARRLSHQLRCSRATIRIQCCWRRVLARSRASRQRVFRVAQLFCRELLSKLPVQIAGVILERAAVQIQKSYRSSRARAWFRHLCSESQKRSWRQNPSKGLALFDRRQYAKAALYLETCKRQGGFGNIDWLIESIKSPLATKSLSSQRLEGPWSRVSFSLFATSSSSNLRDINNELGTTPDSECATTDDIATYLRFWHAYSLSHFFTYEASGEQINLRQAREGFQVCTTIHDAINARLDSLGFDNSTQDVLQQLSFHCEYRLIQCLFRIGTIAAWNEAQTRIEQLMRSYVGFATDPVTSAQMQDIAMIASMLYYDRGDIPNCCKQLRELKLQDQTLELPLSFTLGILCLQQAHILFKTDAKGIEPELLRQEAINQFQRCYQLVELLPGVGFYHGKLNRAKVIELLEGAPSGSYVLHHDVEPNPITPSTAQGGRNSLLLEVRLPDRVASVPIELQENGTYSIRKLPNHPSHFSLHEFVQCLPASAGVVSELGIRKNFLVPALHNKYQQHNSAETEARAQTKKDMLDWASWLRCIIELSSNSGTCKAGWRNEAWSAVCLEVARDLEYREAWIFSAMVAREVLSWSKTRYKRTCANYIIARSTAQIHRHQDMKRHLELAYIEAGLNHRESKSGLSFGLQSMLAIDRAGGLYSCAYRSKIEPFVSKLDRVMKLERMSIKAWQFNSLTPNLRGDPFCESVLLQRIHEEMYGECGDVFFLRSVLRAHISSYLLTGRWYDDLHLFYAMDSATRLVSLFQHEENSQMSHNQLLHTLKSISMHILSVALPQQLEHETNQFPLQSLLLLWKKLPLMVCFEIAEIIYRLSGYRSTPVVIDDVILICRSLYNRIHSSKPRTIAYSAYEELLMLRLAFLHASNIHEGGDSFRHLENAIGCIDVILALRKERSLMHIASSSLLKKSPPSMRGIKRITWPFAIKVPVSLSDAEIMFIRGFLIEIGENMLSLPAIGRKSWRNYQPLHQEVMQMVAAAQHGEDTAQRYRSSTTFRADRLRGVRIHIGVTQNVRLKNVLHSKPFISIWCEGTTRVTQTQPTWANLVPKWDEFIEFNVKSQHARIVITLLNRSGRFSEDVVLGQTTVFMHELLEAENGILNEKFYELRDPKDANQATVDTRSENIKLFLGFDIILSARPNIESMAKEKLKQKKQGNWDIEELKTNLHGDFRTFVSSRWIWSRFAYVFKREHEYAIASWFFHKAITMASNEPTDAELGTDDVDGVAATVKDLVGLSISLRATMHNLDWEVHGRPWLNHATEVLSQVEGWDSFGAADNGPLRKEIATVRALHELSRSSPLQRAMSEQVPASSQWIAVPRNVASSRPTTGQRTPKVPVMYYFNQDTGQTSAGAPYTAITLHQSIPPPLEYECENSLATTTNGSISFQSRGMIVINETMKHRIAVCQRLVSHDPFGWVAVLNNRRQEMQYFSINDHTKVAGGERRQIRPTSYVLPADKHMLYYVLIIQDAFRRHTARRKRKRLIYGIVRCAYWVTREVIACRKRMAEQSEVARKAALNCLVVMVERGQHLRIGDIISSDPYVLLTLKNPSGEIVASGKTTVRQNTRNPRWSEEFFFPYEYSAHQKLIESTTKKNSLEEACISFVVLDYDALKSDSENDENADLERLPTKDFLGKATIALSSFDHGRRMTMDLDLFGPEDDDEGSNDDQLLPSYPHVRKILGTLTISMQWIHYNSRAWAGNITTRKRRSIVAPRRTESSSKPLLPEDLAQEVKFVCNQLHILTAQISELVISALDPLSRLYKRMKLAQSTGRTAEEAKVHEQRMTAIATTQLYPKFIVAQQSVQNYASLLASMQDHLRTPIQIYISDAFSPVEGSTATRAVNDLLSPPSAPKSCKTTATLVAATLNDQGDSKLSDAHHHLEAAFVMSTELEEWMLKLGTYNLNVGQAMTLYFSNGSAIWPTSLDGGAMTQIRQQLSAIVQILQPGTTNLLSSSNGEQVQLISAAPGAEFKKGAEKVKAEANMAQRKERIKREKKRRARQYIYA